MTPAAPKRPASKKRPKDAAAASKAAKKKRKKPPQSKLSKKAPQTTRAVPDYIPVRNVPLSRRLKVLRGMAATDFIVDPDSHSVIWHYERKDRLYEATVECVTFEGWSKRDGWIQRRADFWEDAEKRIREHVADDYLRRRLDDLEKFERQLETFDAFLQPLTNKDTGEILLDEETGLPRFPLEMPSMDKFAVMYMKLHERILLLRGEATTRTEQLGKAEDVDKSTLNQHLAEPTPIAPKLSRDDLRSMARRVLRAREPALGGSPGGTIDAIAEEVGDDERDQHP